MNDQNKEQPPQPQAMVISELPSDPNLPRGKSSTLVHLGLAPTTLEEGWRLAQVMAKSQLVPKGFQHHPEDVLVAIQLGIEVGLAPMQALQSIAVINGRPSLWGDGFLALIMANEKYEDHDEYYEVDGQRRDGLVFADLKKPETAAVCKFLRRGKATPVTQKFTVGMAIKADLMENNGNGKKAGPWQTYPDRMLKMRARSWAGRDAFPDVLRGITTAEEAMDIPPAPAEPERPAILAPRRLSQASTPAAPAPVQAPAATVAPTTDAVQPRVSPSEGDSAAASAGVRIKDVIISKANGQQSALIIDDQGQQYGTDDLAVIMAATTAKEKGYVMEIIAERRGEESVIVDINRAPEAVGK